MSTRTNYRYAKRKAKGDKAKFQRLMAKLEKKRRQRKRERKLKFG